MEDIREVIFKETQAKLPPEKRATTTGEMCLQRDEGFPCTRALGHDGGHIAHGVLGYIHHEWSV
jgi:hypothetical protein